MQRLWGHFKNFEAAGEQKPSVVCNLKHKHLVKWLLYRHYNLVSFHGKGITVQCHPTPPLFNVAPLLD